MFTTKQRNEAKQCLRDFMDAITANEYKQAKKYTQLTWLSVRKNPHNYLERMFGVMDFSKAEITTTKMPDKDTIVLDVNFTIEGQNWHVRMIPELAPYKAAWVGRWGVVPHSITVVSK